MPVVQDSILIQAPQDRLFALSQDYDMRLRWDPFLRELKFLGGATEAAVGVRTWVRSRNGLTMETEYTTVQPPSVVAMKMTSGPRFFAQFAGSWRFVPRNEGEVEVIFRYSFTTKWKLLRPVLDPLIRAVFHRDIRDRLRGLKQAAEKQQDE